MDLEERLKEVLIRYYTCSMKGPFGLAECCGLSSLLWELVEEKYGQAILQEARIQARAELEALPILAGIDLENMNQLKESIDSYIESARADDDDDDNDDDYDDDDDKYLYGETYGY